jgi:hypothetical protein
MIPQSLRFLLCALVMLLALAVVAISIDHAMKASADILNQYDREVGIQ